MRRLLTLLFALALAGSGAVMSPSAAVDDYPDAACSVFVPSPDRYCAPLPIPAESQMVAATMEPAEGTEELYDALIPAPFAPPSDGKRLIGFQIFWLEIPPSPGSDGSTEEQYMEGAYSLRAERDGKVGWYHLHVPVSSSSLYQAGRDQGLPKYLADMKLVPTDTGYRTDASRRDGEARGPAVVDMDLTLDESAPRDEILERYITQKDVFFGVRPLLDGKLPPAGYQPERWWQSKYTAIPPTQLQEPTKAGTVRLTLDPAGDLDWAPLLGEAPEDGPYVFELPGLFWHAQGVVVLTYNPAG